MKTLARTVFAAGCLVVSAAVVGTLSMPVSTAAYNLLGGSLGTTQRDFRVFDNFSDATANDNTVPHANFPGQTGAVMAIWKAHAEWGSLRRGGNGLGDEAVSNPNLGEGGANFDNSFQGTATDSGNNNSNIHSEIPGGDGGVLAFTLSPISDGWTIKYYATWAWQDGPGDVASGADLQGVATHEIGHSLGLDHSADSMASMYANIAGTGIAQRSIEADDIAGVQAIYGVASAGKPRITSLSCDATVGGSLIVTGSNFATNGGEVWFTKAASSDGNPLKVVGLSSTDGGTKIAVAVPAGVMDGDILVKTNAGGNASLSNAFPFVVGTCLCDDEVAVLDAAGNVVLPRDAEEMTDEIIDMDMGLVEDLYPDAATELDLWYGDYPCEVSIGQEPVPAAATDPDLKAMLMAEGIDVDPEELISSVAAWEAAISSAALAQPIQLGSAPPVTGSYTPPAVPHTTEPDKCYVLGGRDLVFVHGLQLEHIVDKLLLKPGANAKWKQPTSFPGSVENPEFYNANGYFKQVADKVWAKHIQRFLADKGIKNRYLIVAYSCSERLEVAAQCVLTQIGDAMRTGVGVVDPLGISTGKFGTPSFVVVSHSAGVPVIDVAMSAAARYPSSLQAGFIPQFCKANIAFHGAISGSRLATLAVAASGYAAITAPRWLCPLVVVGLNAFKEPEDPSFVCPLLLSVFGSSILVDLVPLVMQEKWGDLIDTTPVRTVTIVGGHPSFWSPIKHLLLPGFDDGVTNINSQVGNPNSTLVWPSGFVPKQVPLLPILGGWLKVYDRGVAQGSLNRAIFQFIEQVIDPLLQPAGLLNPLMVAGGATPFISSTGMLQPVQDPQAGTDRDTLARYGNHFSFLQSTSTHFATNGKFGGFNGVNYTDTLGGETNYEETRVITDLGIYVGYPMPYTASLGIDNEPLLTPGLEPKLRETVRGRAIKFKLFGHKHTWWIWKRRYHLLESTQSLTETDYAYRYLLTNPGVIEPCEAEAWTNLGCSLAGLFGPPLLDGTGALKAGKFVGLDLSNAALNANCVLFVSVQSIPVPFKGGTLCAFPLIVQLGFVTNGLGNLHLQVDPWPADISPNIPIYLQYAVVDSAAVHGVAISNMITAITQ